MYLKNLWPRNFFKGKTPWEYIHLKKPDIAHLKIISSKSWYEVIQKEIKENLDDDSLKLICDNEISLEESSEIQI